MTTPFSCIFLKRPTSLILFFVSHLDGYWPFNNFSFFASLISCTLTMEDKKNRLVFKNRFSVFSKNFGFYKNRVLSFKMALLLGLINWTFVNKSGFTIIPSFSRHDNLNSQEIPHDDIPHNSPLSNKLGGFSMCLDSS